MTATASAEDLRVESREEGPVTRWIEVEVPAARVDVAFARAYRALGRSARVRGFRPGKAPVSVLRKLYGGAVAEDVERELVGDTLGAALERSSVEPVSQPHVESDAPAEGAAFRYRARIEVKPALALCELSGLPAERPSAAVSDDDVEKELESVRQRHAHFVEEAEGAAAANGHLATMDFEGRIDGVAFDGGTGKDVTVELGAGQLIPGFDEQLVGARAGEERSVRVRFPDDYGNAELAGKDAEFSVRVTSLRRREVPALDDEFARDLGEFETLDEVRAKIRESLVVARERAAKAAVRRSLLDALIERVPFDVPPGLVEDRLRRRLHSAAHDLEHRGVARAIAERQVARWEQEWRPLVEREIREEWILEEIAKAQSITADDAEVDAHFEQMAQEQGTDVAKLKKTYRDAGVLEAIRSQVVEEKAVEFLLRGANVSEIAGS
ncbi:MAG: trigger factor [Proteobacteria bacterium]|nr:MAG: trigger factor [Pseudomonadota bacterium]